MSWIKFEAATFDKAEVWQIASDLGIEPDLVVAKLMRVWLWFDQQTLDGNAPSVTKALLDARCSVTGFCNAMIKAGWMQELDGVICLPNFQRHNGSTAKKRLLTHQRVVNHRSCNDSVTQNGENCNAPSVTKALLEKNRIEKNREEVIPPKSPKGERTKKRLYQFSLEDIPEPLKQNNPQDFYRAWALWITHREEIKKPITQTSARQQLAELAKAGRAKAVEMIEFTIAKGWQGLASPDESWGRQRPVKQIEPGQRDPLIVEAEEYLRKQREGAV
jgi:hypothetical protein